MCGWVAHTPIHTYIHTNHHTHPHTPTHTHTHPHAPTHIHTHTHPHIHTNTPPHRECVCNRHIGRAAPSVIGPRDALLPRDPKACQGSPSDRRARRSSRKIPDTASYKPRKRASLPAHTHTHARLFGIACACVCRMGAYGSCPPIQNIILQI